MRLARLISTSLSAGKDGIQRLISRFTYPHITLFSYAGIVLLFSVLSISSTWWSVDSYIQVNADSNRFFSRRIELYTNSFRVVSNFSAPLDLRNLPQSSSMKEQSSTQYSEFDSQSLDPFTSFMRKIRVLIFSECVSALYILGFLALSVVQFLRTLFRWKVSRIFTGAIALYVFSICLALIILVQDIPGRIKQSNLQSDPLTVACDTIEFTDLQGNNVFVDIDCSEISNESKMLVEISGIPIQIITQRWAVSGWWYQIAILPLAIAMAWLINSGYKDLVNELSNTQEFTFFEEDTILLEKIALASREINLDDNS